MDIPKGFCQCGCGGETNISPRDDDRFGHVKGEPYRFVFNHHNRREGSKNPNWRGGRSFHDDGYVYRYKKNHPRARSGPGHRVLEHVMVAERVLGKPLPPKAVVHHVNEDRADNRPENLVICEDNAYHTLLHKRMRALEACGHADWLKCKYCKEYGPPDPELMRFTDKPREAACHWECSRRYCREYYYRRKRERGVA